VQDQAAPDAPSFEPERSIVDRSVEAAVTAADRRATAQAIAPQPSVQPSEAPSQPQPPAPVDEHAVQNKRRLEIVLEELRRTLKGGGFHVNSPTGHIQCGARYTFISLAGPLHTAAAKAHERMLSEHLAGIVQNARHSLLFDLLARTGATYAAAGTRSRRVVFRASIGSHVSDVGGILFPNELIWQDSSGPSDMPGITTEVCQFFEAKQDPQNHAVEPVPGFIASQPASTSMRAALTRLSRRMRDGKVNLNKPDADTIILGQVALIRPAGPVGQDPLAALASRVHVYLDGAQPVQISAALLPTSLLPPASKVQPAKGFFRFIPCAP